MPTPFFLFIQGALPQTDDSTYDQLEKEAKDLKKEHDLIGDAKHKGKDKDGKTNDDGQRTKAGQRMTAGKK